MKRYYMIVLIFFIIVIASLYVTAFLRKPVSIKPFFASFRQNRTLVAAHRGGALLFPENTLTAFTGAVSIGADILEMDIHLSADGIPVVIHDDTVDRTTDGTGRVDGYTLAGLKQLDAGYRFTRQHEPDVFPYRGKGVTIPSVREVFQSFPDMPIILELKENSRELADAVSRLITEFNRYDTTLPASFHPEILEYFRQRHPKMATHASRREVKTFLPASWLALEGLFTPSYQAFIVPPYSGSIQVATARFIQAARNRNLFVGVWTINEPEDMKRLVKNGVDALITDRPDIAVKITAGQPAVP
jgi:glycerophosphoryl diester phosphodiesterase